MRVLVLNAGSSTLKASVVDPPGREPAFAATIEWGADASRQHGRADDFEALLERLVVEGVPIGSLDAVGHRVVHGGTTFTAPVALDDGVVGELAALSDLAPLHNPVAVDTIRLARAALPNLPHVAAFDTAFHATLPPSAVVYALPAAWVEAHGIRRYGFHGLSVAWAVERAGELLHRSPGELRLVVAHLGSGSSVTAVDGGRSAWTSMGMTPLEGLVMGTRAGSVDPGILLRLLASDVPVDVLGHGLEHESGLLGLAGTADMRELLERERAGDARAALAVEVFVRHAAEGIAAAATSLERLDALVFTGGIGEHAGTVRARIVGRLSALGFGGPLDDPAGEGIAFHAAGGQPAVVVVTAREDFVIAAATVAIVAD